VRAVGEVGVLVELEGVELDAETATGPMLVDAAMAARSRAIRACR
jgi:hypothetical protein